jgi:hypothetical protein
MVQAVWNLEIGLIGDEERGHSIIDRLCEQTNVSVEHGAFWMVTYLDLPTVEAALRQLATDLDRIDVGWREVLTIGQVRS